jgi:thiol-disulfide isomerase/thioredoxin
MIGCKNIIAFIRDCGKKTSLFSTGLSDFLSTNIIIMCWHKTGAHKLKGTVFFLSLFFIHSLCAQSVKTPGTKSSSGAQAQMISFTIEGSLGAVKKKADVHLGWQEPWQMGEFLKVSIRNGKFIITGKASQPTLGTLRIVTYNDSSRPEQQAPWECDVRELFICNGKTTIIGSDSLSTAKIVSPCGENDLLRMFDSALNEKTQEQNDVRIALQMAYAKKDSCAIKALQNALKLSDYKLNQVYECFIISHSSSYLAVNLLNAYVYQAKEKESLHLSLGLLQQLHARLQASPLASAIKERIDQKLYSLVGTSIKWLELKDMNGIRSDLANFKGKLLLIDFWASWCSPCRKEFPGLLALYEKYKDKGFEILGISIDDKSNKWIEAIRKDKLTWPQFIDEGPPFGGKASRLYNIRALPSIFLVNQNGVIIAENISLDQIETTVSRLLNQQKNN